ncbi:unnamed protein product [Cyprideis torosa]|uniref:3'-5' exonuclease domain-containing protein n=1 Tax=Cyprideis torosa TaxID=163714 RepID=A0A7R8WHX4_9CRUS|nr:unnamed protein product [Cyprideis torosa]CAG0897156.1 unnamed protein product [Cyprideis torosa]
METFLLPLFFAYEVVLLERVFKEHPEYLPEVLKFMDQFVSIGDRNEQYIFARLHGYEGDFALELYNAKTIRNRISSWLNDFDLMGQIRSICPYMFKRRRQKHVEYTTASFTTGAMPSENFRGMIEDDVDDDPDLRQNVINDLVNAFELEEAVYWVERYNIPSDNLPQYLKDFMSGKISKEHLETHESQLEAASPATNEQLSPEAKSSDPPVPEITYCRCPDEVTNLRCKLSRSRQVALDMEWKVTHTQRRVALIQIAFSETEVTFVDVIALRTDPGEIVRIADALRYPVIVAYGFKSDIETLYKSFPGIPENSIEKWKVLDLCSLSEMLKKYGKRFFPCVGRAGTFGLQKMVKMVLNLDMDKTDRMSNWESRPLTREQELYAARDVTSLLSVLAAWEAEVRSPYSPGLPLEEWEAFRIETNWRFYAVKSRRVLKGHDDHVITCLQFSGHRIVSGSDDKTLKVWSAITGKCLRTLTGHTGAVWSSQMSGSIVVSGSTDRTLKVWDADNGDCIHTLVGHTSTVRCMHLHGNKVVSGSRDTSLRMWDISTGCCLHVLQGHRAAVRCVQYDGKLVVSGAYDFLVKVWKPETETCLHTLSEHTNRVYSLQFNGVHVVSGSLDTSIRVSDVETGQCKHTLVGHESLTTCMELKGNILVSGNADSTVKVWNVLTGQCLQTLSGPNKHQSAVTCLQFNSNFVITSSDDGTVKLWDVRTGEFIRNLVELSSRGAGGVVWKIKADSTKLVCAVGSPHGTEETKLLVLDFDDERNSAGHLSVLNFVDSQDSS